MRYRNRPLVRVLQYINWYFSTSTSRCHKPQPASTSWINFSAVSVMDTTATWLEEKTVLYITMRLKNLGKLVYVEICWKRWGTCADGEVGQISAWYYHHAVIALRGGGGKGVTSAWSPLGNFLEGQVHPNLHRTRFCYFFDVKFFVLSGGFSLRLLCLFSNSFHFKFFIYSYLYIHIYIFYIFFHCTCGALQCSHGLWSLCRASSRWQTRSPAVGAL